MSVTPELEAVAKAICRSFRETTGFKPRVTGPAPYTLDDEVANCWEDFVDEARAALRAIREPTDAMFDAMYHGEVPGIGLNHTGAWRQAIDHILGETP